MKAFRQLVLVLLLTSCLAELPPLVDPGVVSPSEVVPSTIIALTEPPVGQFAPLTEETPAIVIEPPIPLPTATPVPASVGVPLEELALIKPGPGSFLRDPIHVEGYGGPSQNNRVQLRLYGEQGRLIAQGYTFLYSYPGAPGQFFGEIPFDTPLVAETGWLEVRSFGDRYGLLRHLTKFQVNLLSTGSEKIYPAIRGAEKLTLFSPREESRISGGTLTVSGAGWVDRDEPLGIEVLDAQGKVLASTTVPLVAPEVGLLGTFEVALDYQINFPQWARIGVFERHGDVPGLIHYTSVQVWLQP